MPTLGDELLRRVPAIARRKPRKWTPSTRPCALSPRTLTWASERIPELTREELEAAAAQARLTLAIEDAGLLELNEALRAWVMERLSQNQIAATKKPKPTASMRARTGQG